MSNLERVESLDENRDSDDRREFSWRTVFFGFIRSRRRDTRRDNEDAPLYTDWHHPWCATDYSYSEALASSNFVWTPRALDAWLAQPYPFLPGNRMSYPGLPDGDDRKAVIAYLLHYTDAGNQE